MKSNFIAIEDLGNNISYWMYYMDECLGLLGFNFVMSQHISVALFLDHKMAIL